MRGSPVPESNVSVAIPIRDGGALLARTLAALARQTVEHELLVCDSGSTDESVDLARRYGARVLEIPHQDFNHGATRNVLMREAEGARVALLTQDAEPADERWLERLLEGFAQAEDVAIVYGPYRPRADAAFAVRTELEQWFASLSPDGSPRVDRLSEDERPSGSTDRGLAGVGLIGRRGFFTDANACLARAAWERVPFREVPYAEDRVLAIDMLRAGYSKVFMPHAAVLHSHAYTTSEQLRRSFDEWRGLREVYGWREPAAPAPPGAAAARSVGRGPARADPRRRLFRAPPKRRSSRWAVTTSVRLAGALLGSRADRLPPAVRRRLSLEGRAGFAPLDLLCDSGQPAEDSFSR